MLYVHCSQNGKNNYVTSDIYKRIFAAMGFFRNPKGCQKYTNLETPLESLFPS